MVTSKGFSHFAVVYTTKETKKIHEEYKRDFPLPTDLYLGA